MPEATQPYRTIKALVFDHVHRNGGVVAYDALTAQVLRHFPGSLWKPAHWAWYRHQILRGRFRHEFSDEERGNLLGAGKDEAHEAVKPLPPSAPRTESSPVARGPQARDAKVKRIGDAILNQVRFIVELAAPGDADLRFKLNRWVFSRLLHDELRVKRPIKQALWDAGMRSCQACGETFASLKGVELHRRDAERGYTKENCELLCRECHQQMPHSAGDAHSDIA